jgi:hypothetical protein
MEGKSRTLGGNEEFTKKVSARENILEIKK